MTNMLCARAASSSWLLRLLFSMATVVLSSTSPTLAFQRAMTIYSTSTRNLQPSLSPQQRPAHLFLTPAKSSTLLSMGYVRPEENEDSGSAIATTVKKGITPQIGDLVRYYDLYGGNVKGQELVGKITFLTKVGGSGYLAELTQLEDLGEGYFAEFSSTQRMRKKSDRDVSEVAPLMASYVRSEQAYKVPYDSTTGRVKVRQEQYDLDDWKGPAAAIVNQDVVQADGILYAELKAKLLKNAALTGLLGSVLVNILKGPEDAAIYFAGAVASVAYLFFLSIKTDTLASPDRKLGSNVSNLRFLMPVLVVVGVAVYNQMNLDTGAPAKDNPFDRMTSEQFGAAILGFLTYRIPLFLGQLQEALQSDKDGDAASLLPGSAGVALQLAKGDASQATSALDEDDLIPVLLISGPQATGRDELVQALLAADDRVVSPILVDKLSDGVTFERLNSRNEFLDVDQEERFGLTKDGILQAAATALVAADSSTTADDSAGEAAPSLSSQKKVVVVNADVALAQKLAASLSGSRLIGVWIGLDSVQEFERRIEAQIDQGLIPIEDEEDETVTRETVIRGRIKEIVKEIDFGLSSGIFEFTILNKDPAQSFKELKEAVGYCFK